MTIADLRLELDGVCVAAGRVQHDGSEEQIARIRGLLDTFMLGLNKELYGTVEHPRNCETRWGDYSIRTKLADWAAGLDQTHPK